MGSGIHLSFRSSWSFLRFCTQTSNTKRMVTQHLLGTADIRLSVTYIRGVFHTLASMQDRTITILTDIDSRMLIVAFELRHHWITDIVEELFIYKRAQLRRSLERHWFYFLDNLSESAIWIVNENIWKYQVSHVFLSRFVEPMQVISEHIRDWTLLLASIASRITSKSISSWIYSVLFICNSWYIDVSWFR